MIQSIVHLDNKTTMTLTKDRYKGLLTEFSNQNYELELNRNGQSFCLYMDKSVMRDVVDSLVRFLKENEEN